MKGVSHKTETWETTAATVFVVLVGLLVALSTFLPAALVNQWRQIVLWTAWTLGRACAIEVAIRGEILTVNGFAMQVADECTALSYVMILASAMLLYTRHTIAYRAAGVVVGTLMIVVINAIRLVVTGIAGSISWQMFNIMHEYLWVALFALLIFGIWKVWADGGLRLSRQKRRWGCMVVAVSSVVFALLIAIMPVYAPFLAYVSSLFLKLALWDSEGTISWIGNSMQGKYGGTSFQVPFALEYFNVAVLAGLVFPQQRKGETKIFLLSVMALTGAIVLNAAMIANAVFLIIKHGQNVLYQFILIEKGLLLAAPFALWAIIVGGGRGGAVDGMVGDA